MYGQVAQRPRKARTALTGADGFRLYLWRWDKARGPHGRPQLLGEIGSEDMEQAVGQDIVDGQNGEHVRTGEHGHYGQNGHRIQNGEIKKAKNIK